MSQADNPKIAICDLDHTLIRSDMLFENLLVAIKKNVLVLAMLPFWLLKGRAFMKDKIFSIGQVKPEDLPFNERLIAYLEKLKIEGYKVYLATASMQETADAIAKHTDLFDGAFGSNAQHNLKAGNKKRFLDERFGVGNYIYLGDSEADLKVWKGCRGAVVVGGSRSFQRRVEQNCKVIDLIPSRDKSYLKTFIKQIRV